MFSKTKVKVRTQKYSWKLFMLYWSASESCVNKK